MKYAHYTDKGSRDINEDCIGIFNKGDVFCAVVADGLGGHGMGDKASRIVTEAAGTFFMAYDIGYVDDFLGRMFVYCNDTLMEAISNSDVDMGRMKTTLVAALGIENKIWFCHCGDSRGYLFSHGKLIKRTLDHSVPQALVSSGEIKESAIRNHPDRNRLLKCLGYEWPKPLYEADHGYGIKGGETVILCTDGFWELVLEREMGFTDFFEKDPEKKLEKLRKIIDKKGNGRKMDNNSAIILTLEKD